MSAQENESHYGELHRIDTPALDRSLFTDEADWIKNRKWKRERVLSEFLDRHAHACQFYDKDKLPDPAAFEAAVTFPSLDEHWDDDYKFSRYLFGPTGLCKTRAAVEYVKRRFVWWDNERVCWWSSYGLKQKLFALRNDVSRKEWFISWLSDEDCMLVIDDFGHQVTESYLEVIRIILDAQDVFTTVIVTSQYSLEEFVDRCGEQGMGKLGEAVARRLFDLCQRIEFRRGRKVADTPAPTCASKPSDSDDAPAVVSVR